MREQVSALLDGELDEQQQATVLNALSEDAELLQDWQLYHLIGDVMRGDGAGSVNVAGRVAAQLVNEPVPAVATAEHDIKPQRRNRLAANRAWYSLAASLAGIAFVGWAALQSLTPSKDASPGALAQQATAPVEQRVQPVAYQSRMSDYWAAHRQMSGHMIDSQDQQVQFVSVEVSDGERQ